MDDAILSQLADTVVSGLVTLVAAFVGAWYAFRLSDRDRARQTEREQVAAVNRAQFVLIQQFNGLKMIQSQIIEPVRQHPGRSVAMRPVLPVVGPPVRLDCDSLSFLLETDDRELLFNLLIEQQRFDAALQIMNERSRLHLEVLQPRLATAGIREGEDYSREAVVDAVGNELVVRLERATADAIEHVDKTIESCPVLIAEFYRAMKLRFPKHVVIRLAPEGPSNQPLQPTSGRES
jgi:hypothetical protein